MSKPSKIAEAIIGALAGSLGPVMSEKFKILISEIQPATTRRDVVLSLYPPFASQLARLAAATKTPLDDVGVESIVEALEAVARADGFELPKFDPQTSSL